MPVERTWISPPRCRVGSITAEERAQFEPAARRRQMRHRSIAGRPETHEADGVGESCGRIREGGARRCLAPAEPEDRAPSPSRAARRSPARS